MKKTLLSLICVLLAMCVISASGVYAQTAGAAETGIPEIDIDDIGTAAESDSYTITDGDETLLEVVHIAEPGLTSAVNDITSNGYYTARFMLPNTNFEVFLTGLTQNNADEIRREIIDSYYEGYDFDMCDIDFLDTEKTWELDGDDSLCWAAAASNVLTYTGWGAEAGFESTDDLFEHYISCFNDGGGSPYYAYSWFFNGIKGKSGSQPAEGTGCYIPQYYYGELTELYRFYPSDDMLTKPESSPEWNMSCIDKALRDGCGVTLSVDIYRDGAYESGHSITCWGLMTDIRYPENNPLRYKSIFVTDSDSDKLYVRNGMDRRDADNIMSMFNLQKVSHGVYDTWSIAITSTQTALIKEAITLVPYSEDLPHETLTYASCDARTKGDICISPFYLTDDQNIDRTQTKFVVGTHVYYKPFFTNVTGVDYYGNFSASVKVTNAEGTVVHSKNLNAGEDSVEAMSNASWAYIAIPPRNLPVGDYTITVDFNPSRKGNNEAYYYNNVKSLNFKVREAYLTGDTDNDGEVAIIDVTYIQRILACYSDQWDEYVHQRCDVNNNGETDVMDATIIQRYLAMNEQILYPVNTNEIYD